MYTLVESLIGDTATGSYQYQDFNTPLTCVGLFFFFVARLDKMTLKLKVRRGLLIHYVRTLGCMMWLQRRHTNREK